MAIHESPPLLAWMRGRAAVAALPAPVATPPQILATTPSGVTWATDGYAIWRSGSVPVGDWSPMGAARALRPGEIDAAITPSGETRPARIEGDRVAWAGGSMPIPARHRGLMEGRDLEVELIPWGDTLPSPGMIAAVAHLASAGVSTGLDTPDLPLRPVCVRALQGGEVVALIGAIWGDASPTPPSNAPRPGGGCPDPDGGGSRDCALGGGMMIDDLGVPAILTISGTSKWLIVHPMRTDMVIDHKVVVLAFATWRAYALLQSLVHLVWARFSGLHSTMQTTARYTTSTIFNTFPFPRPSQTHLDILDDLGRYHYLGRIELQERLKLGATKLTNRVNDPAEGCPWILELRERQRDIDACVLDAYGWHDIDPPDPSTLPPCAEAATPAAPIPPVFAEITRRLRRLNAKRAREQDDPTSADPVITPCRCCLASWEGDGWRYRVEE